MEIFSDNLSDNFKKYISIYSFYNKRLEIEIILLEYLKSYNIDIPINLLENLKNNFSIDKIKHLYNSSNLYNTSKVLEYMEDLLPNNISPYISLGINNESMEEITIILVTRNIMILIKDYLNNILIKLKLDQDILERGNKIIKRFSDIEYKIKLKSDKSLFIKYLNLENYDINITDYLSSFKLNSDTEDFTTIKNINILFIDIIKYFDIIKDIHIFNLLLREIKFKCDMFQQNISSNTLYMFIDNLKLILSLFDKINILFKKEKDNTKIKNILKILSINDIHPNTNQLSLLSDTDQSILIFIESVMCSKDIKNFIFQHFIEDKSILDNLDLIKKQQISRMGLWNNFWKTRKNKKYQECSIMKHSIKFFDTDKIKHIQDWGCGNCKLKNYISRNKYYLGIDGSETGFQDKIIDLVNYKTKCDAVFIKHVLEHNILWKEILLNFLNSFTVRGILIIYTPFSKETKVIGETLNGKNTNNYLVSVEKMSFNKQEIIDIIKSLDISFKFEEIESNNEFKKDNIFYLQK